MIGYTQGSLIVPLIVAPLNTRGLIVDARVPPDPHERLRRRTPVLVFWGQPTLLALKAALGVLALARRERFDVREFLIRQQ